MLLNYRLISDSVARSINDSVRGHRVCTYIYDKLAQDMVGNSWNFSPTYQDVSVALFKHVNSNQFERDPREYLLVIAGFLDDEGGLFPFRDDGDYSYEGGYAAVPLTDFVLSKDEDVSYEDKKIIN